MDRRKKILVVDDDTGILESFDVLLGEEHDMVSAQSGDEALQKLRAAPYQLVFLDIKMPGMSGIEVLRWIRSQPAAPRVVIVTALPNEEYEEEARLLGIDEYVKKPFDVGEIQRIVDCA